MENKRHAYFKSQLKAVRSDDNNTHERYIEGYFAVFNQETELWRDGFEKIANGAFDNSLKNNDIRCLFNHDSGFVLGRTSSNTLELKVDSHGLWGRVRINEQDSQANDVYARVERGDISGCSFGFNPVQEDYINRGDSMVCTILEADMHEVSICTFPAYPQTEIQARQQLFTQTKSREVQAKKLTLKTKLEDMKC